MSGEFFDNCKRFDARIKTHFGTLLRWVILALVMLGVASPAMAAKTYTDNGDGTVTDPTTGLQWMRCSMGQTWDGVNSTCTGTASTYTFDQANALTGTVTFAGQSDWRVPNIRELQTIVDLSVYNPAIDLVAFPATPSSNYWSSLPLTYYSYNAWGIGFYFGNGTIYSRSGGLLAVRLVRAGQSLGILDVARPSISYVDQGDGTVTHTPTRLMWQRCALGQTWTGSTCSGSASIHPWDVANALTGNFAAHSDWRLPTSDELLSLVDYSKISPAIDTTLFPGTPSSVFWSGSAYAIDSGTAWGVQFNGGYANGSDRSASNAVRLVRAGQCFGPLALAIGQTGTGQIASSLSTGSNTSTKCDTVTGATGYFADDVVTLSANPVANLIAWGGACASSGNAATCTVTMDAAKAVTASFKVTGLVSGLPTKLNFALLNKGSTSTAQSVSLTNTGTAALAISSIVTTGDFSVTNNCGSGLGVAGFCALNVSFSPTATGARTGTLTITSNAPGSPHTINLSGSGQGAVASLTGSIGATPPSGFGSFFSNTNMGASSARTFTLTNAGGEILNISGISISGDFAKSTTCGSTLDLAANCTITVTFSPAAAGTRTGSLVINSDSAKGAFTNSGNGTITLGLSGTGVAVPVVSLSTTSLSYVAQTIGISSVAQVVKLTNSGGAALSLGSVSASGDFAVTNNCGAGLGAGGFCDLSVTFSPTAAGNRVGTVTISDNATGSPHSISLSGVGDALAQTISLGAAPTLVVGGSGIVAAMSSSGLSVTFGTSTSAICSVAGATVTGLAAGDCVVTANQSGNTTYAAAPQSTQIIAVSAGAQSVNFGLAPTLFVGGTSTLTAIGGASGNPVMFASTTPAVCTVGGTNGSTVTALAAGNCVIAANQAASTNYTAASQATLTIAVSAGAQSVTFGLAPTLVVGGTGTVSATGGASGNPVTLTSTTPSVCTVSGTAVTVLLAGNCTIAANQAGNANYTAAPQTTQTIAVGAGAQNISFGFAPTLAVGATGTVGATGGLSGNPVTFTSTTLLICTVAGTNGSTVTALTAGNCVISANQAASANYTAAPQTTQTIAVSAGTQSVSFGFAPALSVGGSGTVTATGGASGNAVTFTTTTPTICTVAGTNGSTVTALAAGSCVIAANQAGNANYTAAPQTTQTIAVSAGTQSVSFGSAPTLVVGGTGTVSATGGASGNPITFTSTTPTVCSVSGTTVTVLLAGNCTIAANQAGNANYSAAVQTTQSIGVGQASLVLLQGWNLLGNATNSPVTVSAQFSDPAVVTTVWKWDTAALGWQFYAPTMTAAELQNYASGKGYGVLTAINPGEGFWVNAKVNATLAAFSGTAFNLSAEQLVKGWNLVATAADATPAAFNLSLTDPLIAPPTVGAVPINLTTLWAWDNLQGKWYFYAPNLEGQGGTALFDYIASKGYLDFTTTNKTLGNGIGFWVNSPISPSVPVSGKTVMESEYNDALAFATPFDLTDILTGSLANAADVDWFKVPISTGGMVSVTFDSSPMTFGMWNVSWYAPDMTIMSGRNIGASIGGAKLTYQFPAFQLGTYTLRVQASNSTFYNGGGYFVTVVPVP
ncbi:MAG: hypothetical protein COW02_18920 [Comamonadaceae bacterium CG12_big_fil_rev_8_21_14_0_65_59_15]|nr:MAG: hypothetical protein COW02_18920 [Comamonadaceae bacterium CG12_big_fil_rev_8_21_14_0_65_59_15]